MVSGECNVSSDCLDGSGIIRVCYEEASFSDETFFCDCNNWYGWTGEDCSEESSQLRYFRFSLTLIAIWGFIVMFFISKSLFYFIRAKMMSGKKFDPAFYTAILSFSGCFLFALHSLVHLPAMFDHTRFEIEVFNDFSGKFEDVTVKGGRFAIYFHIFGTVALLGASVQIVSSWSNVIASTSKFFPNLFYIRESTLRAIVKAYTIFLGIVLIASLSTDVIFAWTLVVSFTTGIVALIYVIVYKRFVTVLRSLANSEDEARSAIQVVRLSFQVNALCLVLVSFFTALLAVLYADYRRHLDLGAFNTTLFVRDLSSFSTLFMYTFNSWYLHRVTVKILELDENHTCFPKLRLTSQRSRAGTSGSVLQEKQMNQESFEIIPPIDLGGGHHLEL